MMMMMILVKFFVMFSILLKYKKDIALDGWAITMLRKENVGFQSICNGVGQSTGFFMGMTHKYKIIKIEKRF